VEWSVLVPVKRLAAAKTRLRGAVGAERHEPLVLAMAQDTVAAALAAPGIADVLVVTADPLVSAAVTALGARAVAEPGPGSVPGGLNAALRHAASAVVGRIAALPADLPALRGDELSVALSTLATACGGGYVPDASGTGTVLLVAAAGGRLVPRFGPGSAAAHGQGGARRVEGDWPSLRHDVDTPADLAIAVALGVGAHTRALLRTGIAV
jgi:2-phospho-L-lactate guanylyltransferase